MYGTEDPYKYMQLKCKPNIRKTYFVKG